MLRKTTNAPKSSQHRKSGCDLFTAEYEINDIRPAARNILTKGQTHDEISQVAGASISTRGRFISVAEKRSGAPINDRPLYLFIQGKTKDSVDLAVQKVEEIIQMDNPVAFRGVVNQYLPGHSHSHSINPNTSHLALQQTATMPPPIVSGGMAITNTTNTVPTSSTCVEKIYIGLDHAPPNFDLRSRIIGTGGANLNYIRNETRAMATLRGRGSLFVDPLLNMESPEPIHLYIETLRYEELQAAKQLARNLIETLQQELVQFQQMNPPQQQQPPNNIQHFSAQTTVVQQPHIYTQHTMTQPPPPMITVPPPVVAPGTTTLVQTTHQVPVQLHPPSLVQLQPPPTLPIPIKTITTPAVPPPHLSQPPPSIQHLQHPPTQTQIVVNQSVPIPIKTMVPMTVQTTPQPNYQYQYIHTTGQEATPAAAATGPSGAVTIQHIYQSPHPSLPPQHVQSIMQPATYMVPPPNLLQTTTQVPTTSIIYSSHPPPQLLQQPPNYSMAQAVHQVITVQQPAGAVTRVIPAPPPPGPGDAVKLEENAEEHGKLEESTIVSCPMTGVPPIMSVPPPTVQHIMVPNSYATSIQPPPHMYGQVPSSSWPASSQPQGVPVHHGGITYQQIQHPIMTPATSMGLPVPYPPMPQTQAVMKINHQVPPPPFPNSAGQVVMPTGHPPPPQPVPYPMQQPPPGPPPPTQENLNPNMMRPGQKRKMVDDGGVDGSKNGHGERHLKMAGGPASSMGGGDYVATSSALGSRVSSLITTSNTNSNDLNQDSYAVSGHRLDDRNHSVNQMTMPDMGDLHQPPNCGLPIDQQQPPPPLDDGSGYPGADLSHPPPGVRCNIIGKPPPPLPGHMQSRPESMSILANTSQQVHRYSNQW